MGGLVLVVSVAVSAILLADLTNIYVWVTLVVLCIFAGLGFADDYKKVIKKDSKGVSARMKLVWQFGGATFCVGEVEGRIERCRKNFENWCWTFAYPVPIILHKGIILCHRSTAFADSRFFEPLRVTSSSKCLGMHSDR